MDENKFPKKDLQSEINSQLGVIDNSLVSSPSVEKPTTQNVGGVSMIPQKPVIAEAVLNQEDFTPKETTPADNYQVSSIRTYKADVNQTVQTDGVTTAKILMAEQVKKEKEKKTKDKNSIENPKNKFKLASSLFFIGLAVVAILYASSMYLIPKPKVDQQVNPNQSTGFFVIDNKEYLNTTDLSKEITKNEIDNFLKKDFKENTINELILYRNNIVNDVDVPEKLKTGVLFDLLGFSPPTTFARVLSNSYLFGVYRTGSENKTFVLFQVEDFGNTYSSIFDYEKSLVSDMKKLFGGFVEFDMLNELKSQKTKLLPEDLVKSDDIANQEIKEEPVVEEGVDTPEEGDVVVEIEKTPEEKLLEIEVKIKELEIKTNSYKNFIDIVLKNNDSRAILGDSSNVLFYYTLVIIILKLFGVSND